MSQSFSRNDLDACPHLKSLRLNHMAMSDDRFVSDTIAIAGESELATINWQIIVCMSNEQRSRNWNATILQLQSRSSDIVQVI